MAEAENVVSEVEATKLFDSSEVSWYTIVDGKQKLLVTGNLQAAMVVHDGRTLLILRTYSPWVENQEEKYALSTDLPSMKAGPKEFVFPSETGYYGMKFGAGVSDAKITAFVNLLKNFSAYSEAVDVLSNVDVKKDLNTKVTENSEIANKYVSKGTNTIVESIDTVSKATSRGIKWATGKLKKRIKPNEKPMEVSEPVKWQAEKMKQMGGVAVTFSKSMVTGAVATASQLTSALYQNTHNTKQGKQVEKVMADPKAQAAAKTAVVAASAAWEIYLAMAEAGVQFVSDVADATADVVEHKYGDDAGEATRNALSAATQGVQALNIVNKAPYTAVAEGVLMKTKEKVTETSVKVAIDPSKQIKDVPKKKEVEVIGDLD